MSDRPTSPTELLARELHYSHLRSLGFRKKGKVFSRDLEDYSEMVQIEASSFNMAPGPWRFYLTIGARFRNVTPPPGSPADKSRVHAVGSLRTVLPDTPPWYDVELNNLPGQAKQIAEIILKALGRLPDLLDPARENATKGFMTVIASANNAN